MADELPFVLTAEFGDRVAEVAVTGELDITTVPALADMLTVALDRQPRRLVVDLSYVQYLDCAAARVIGEAAQALPGHQLIIRNPMPIVRRLLQLTGLESLIGDGRDGPAPGAATGPETVAVTAAVDGRICVLTVTGALDLPAVDGFLTQATAALAGQPERLVLDLGGLAFLDCAGARALARLAAAVPPGCPVIVRAVSPAATRLLRAAGLNLDRPPAPDAAVLPDERLTHPDKRLTQQVQLTHARMADLTARIQQTAGQLASTGDRVAATFARLAEQHPDDADRLTALSTAAHEFAARSRRNAVTPAGSGMTGPGQ